MKNQMELKDLFDKFKCDKSSKHGYHEVYESLFCNLRFKKINFFEIGIFKGASTAAFHEYFENGMIEGIDIFTRSDPEELNILQEARVRWLKGNSMLPSVVDQMNTFTKGKKYDVILDDGAHYPEANMLTFRHMKNFLKPNGMYIIEDIFPLEIMSDAELKHPWIKRHSEKYSVAANDAFLSELNNSGMKIERYDLRKQSGEPDSYTVVLRNK